MKLLDLEHENEVAVTRIGDQWSNAQANNYCANLPKIEALKKAIEILKQSNNGIQQCK